MMHNFIRIWLKWTHGWIPQFLSMYGQDQSTNFSILQLQMESLQGWADDLVKNGRGKDLLSLFASLPVFQKLRGLGIGFSFSFSIDDIGKIELGELEELAKTVAPQIGEIKPESAFVESSVSSQDQSLYAAFTRSIFLEVETYTARLKENDKPLERLISMSKAFSGYVENTCSIFADYMDKTGATANVRNGFDFYAIFQKQRVRNYIDLLLLAVKSIDQNIQRQIRKGRIIVTQQSSQQVSVRKSTVQKNESKNQEPIPDKQKQQSSKKKAEKPAGQSAKISTEKSHKSFVKLPVLVLSPYNPQKKQGKSKSKSKPKN